MRLFCTRVYLMNDNEPQESSSEGASAKRAKPEPLEDYKKRLSMKDLDEFMANSLKSCLITQTA